MLFCIVNFNTTILTTCACASIVKNHPDAKFVIFDNSDKVPFGNLGLFDITYIDNTKGQIINFENELNKYPDRTVVQQMMTGKINFGSAKHSMTIQWLLDNLDKDFILCDSDILLKRPIDFVDKTKVCVSDIDEKHRDKDIYRSLPFIAYMNTPLIRKKNLRYFDGNRMHALTRGRGFWYDTGAAFYENILNCDRHLFKRINFNKYVIHFKAGSWKDFDNNLLLKYIDLWKI